MQRLKILHLEDDLFDAELMSRTLADVGMECDILRVDSEAQFRTAIRDNRFDLIVSDFSMPGFDGRSALNIAREQVPEVPFIFVSGTIGEEAAIDSLLAGATDYVLKHQFFRLVPAIQRARRDSEQRQERKAIEAQLLRTQRMESIGTLAGGIAHDLNNVLAPILMAVQLLKESHKDPSSQRLLDTLEASAKRGANIVRQVLTFARGVEGQHVPVEVRHLLNSMEKMIAETFPKSIRIHLDVPKDLWFVVGDATQLDQVLLNLCVNARDAMPNGGQLRITAQNNILDEHYARLHVDAKAGPHVMIEVADSGHGIPPNIIDKIFEPFFTTKELGMGTGMGLSTVTAIVKSHKGFVHVYSEPGKGTSFKVFLPAKESVATRDAAAQIADSPRGNGEWILVVDDEAAVLEIAHVTLEFYGYRVVTARNGAEALACYALQRGEIKAVLLDMMMPIMDGPATVHALRAVNPEVRIIAASGLMENARNVSVSEQDRVAIRAILSKPFTADELLTTVHEVLR